MSQKPKSSRSLIGIAGIVAAATLLSKLFGFVREIIIAAAFGTGPVVDAYAYAYVIPGFLLILLGGINGPFHSALVSVLSKREKTEAAPLVETVSTLVTGILLLVTVALVLFSGTFIDLLAPGLGALERAIAIQQLQIMAPLAIFAGLIGIGFGTLNASDQYWLPSVSPLLSSVSICLGVVILFWVVGGDLQSPQYLQLSAMVLAGGTLAGGILQWFAQVIAQGKSGLGKLRLRFNWRIPGVTDVLKVMVPATLSSGMLHINVYTDLWFASSIQGAAAAMRYGNLIVLTPLGVISNVLLVPMLPVFSRLAAPENWDDLKVRIRQGLMLSALTMLPLTAIFTSLSLPIIRIVYQRSAFGEQDSQFVAPVLAAYGLGMFFYLARDVLVRVFYGLGDGETPFRISIANIFLNGILDYFLVNAFKTPGLVFATIGVNVVSMVILLWILHRRLNGLPLWQWGWKIVALMVASALAGFSSLGISRLWDNYLGIGNPFLQVGQLGVAISIAMVIFTVIALQLKLPEIDILVSRLRQKFER